MCYYPLCWPVQKWSLRAHLGWASWSLMGCHMLCFKNTSLSLEPFHWNSLSLHCGSQPWDDAAVTQMVSPSSRTLLSICHICQEEVDSQEELWFKNDFWTFKNLSPEITDAILRRKLIWGYSMRNCSGRTCLPHTDKNSPFTIWI